jgi:maleamate amidohydrolase
MTEGALLTETGMTMTRNGSAQSVATNTASEKPVERVWDKFLTEKDKYVFANSGYGRHGGFGSRPAMVIVDVNYNFVGDKPAEITGQLKEWRNACGIEGWNAIKVIKHVIDACRARNVPIFYTTNTRRPDGWDATSRTWKNTRALEDYEREMRGNEIVADIAPEPRDIVIVKPKPSGFFGTPLLSYLVYMRIDTLLVCGVSTSGCVRATVTDAFSNNFRVSLIEDGCFDRSESSHAVNLRDMDAKYADVISSAEVIKYVQTIPTDLIELPAGKVIST